MAGIRLPPEEPETTPQQQARATATDSLASDDDRSIAADSWSIKSEYGSTLDDDKRHADAAEALSSANFRVSSDYSSDKEEPDAMEDSQCLVSKAIGTLLTLMSSLISGSMAIPAKFGLVMMSWKL
ncbi:hypothetical protein Bca4012_019881 [Brassica carinata]|uniref:Uncharacterized protein n=1 Tax=Brassica carinata TaxID=52824 RepID=A0A8X8BD19_BRACI|nr:hypothetical protein Bca52824_001715 [Brassica carinata]